MEILLVLNSFFFNLRGSDIIELGETTSDYNIPDIGKNALEQLAGGDGEGWQPEENLKVISELACGQDPQEAFDKSIEKIQEKVETIIENQADKKSDDFQIRNRKSSKI